MTLLSVRTTPNRRKGNAASHETRSDLACSIISCIRPLTSRSLFVVGSMQHSQPSNHKSQAVTAVRLSACCGMTACLIAISSIAISFDCHLSPHLVHAEHNSDLDGSEAQPRRVEQHDESKCTVRDGVTVVRNCGRVHIAHWCR